MFTNTRNFPDSKEFALNQYKADQLVVTSLPLTFKKYEEAKEKVEQAQEKTAQFVDKNAGFLCETGFTPEYLTERKNRRNLMRATPILSGLSIATGLYIIFAMNFFLAALLGISIGYASFYFARMDKVLESDERLKWTFLIFLAIDAVLLVIGLAIGLSNEVPMVYLFIHVLICVFALLLNFSMIKHAENFNQDKTRGTKKVQFENLKKLEEKLLSEVLKFKEELRKLVNEVGSQAVALRANFVAHNYDPSTLRMALDTRIALNQFFGYDLFPVVDEIVSPDYAWDRRSITKWNVDTSSKYPEILSEYGPFSSTATFTAPAANRQLNNGNTTTNGILNNPSLPAGALNENNPSTSGGMDDLGINEPTGRPQGNNQPIIAEASTFASVNQTAESENEL